MIRQIKHLRPRAAYGPAPTAALWVACAVSGTLLRDTDLDNPTNGTGRLYLLIALLAGMGAMARTIVRGSRKRTATIVATLKLHERREEAAIDAGIDVAVERLADIAGGGHSPRHRHGAGNPWLPATRLATANTAGPGATIHPITQAAANRAS